MGNYRDLEYDFIERTLNLISQYEHMLHKYKFEEQYNYTPADELFDRPDRASKGAHA